MVSIDDFLKIELQVGTVLEAEEVEGSDKLLKLKINLGEEQPRQIIAGIKSSHPDPKVLVGTQFVVVTNLEPRKLMSYQSQGMILCADPGPDESGVIKPVCLRPSKPVPAGTKIR